MKLRMLTITALALAVAAGNAWAAHETGGFLGVQLTDLTAELRSHFGVPEEAGVMVSKVIEDSAAARAGIEVGDVIALVDGESVTSSRSLAGAIGGREEGSTVTLEIWRDGEVRQLSATLAERPASRLMPKMRMMRGGHEGMHHGSMHHGSMHHGSRTGEQRIEKRIEIRCNDGEEDCGAGLGDLDIDCEAEDCEVRVRCEEDGCDCSVNGDEVDCAEIGVPEG